MRHTLGIVLLVAVALLSGGCVGPFGCVCRDPELSPPSVDAPGRESAKLGAPNGQHYHSGIDGRPAVPKEDNES